MEKSYGENEVIFQEGDVGRACFIVAEGSVEILRSDPVSGREEQMGIMGPGDFFGEMVLLDELPRSATARTLSATRLHILYKSHFDVLLANHGRVALELLHNLARLLSARLRRQNEDVLSRGRSAAPPANP
jgi:CRP-like cAMP-binding protein